MDSEEKRHIEHLQETGRAVTDEGPAYHQAWWEAYKGGVKGTLGGLLIGALVGAAMGGVVGGIMLLARAELAVIWPVVAGLSAFCMIEGAIKFANVGVATGAAASSQQIAERRMKQFENSKFAELKREMRELKELITGKKLEAAAEIAATEVPVPPAESGYRTQHRDEHPLAAGLSRPLFWKVAAIGAAVGAAAGGLLEVSGMANTIMEHMPEGIKSMTEALPAENMLMPGLGAVLGASFGINRDIFRGVFDITDHWFRGILIPEQSRAPEKTQQTALATEKKAAHAPEIHTQPEEAVRMAFASEAKHVSTFHRDRVGTLAARQALLSFDHTNARGH